MKSKKNLIIFYLLIIFSINLRAQKLKMILKIIEPEISNSNSFKYNIEIINYSNDTIYNYITSSNYIIEFDYDNIYKIRIYGNDTSEHQLFLVNNSINKKDSLNLIIPLYKERNKLVKNFIYYSRNKNKFYIEKI